MALWKNPRWFDAENRFKQLDDNVRTTGQARFGLKSCTEEKKVDAVTAHFNRVAPKYDFMNSLLSLGIQHVWKRTAIRMLAPSPGDRVLDVCGGTGDLALLAASRVGSSGRVVIYDINRAMMEAGRQKISLERLSSRIQWVQGDAEKIAFPDNSFDAAMVGFGIRNLTHLEAGFKEMHRVLRSGGRLLCLEFSKPTNRLFRGLYDFYSFNVMPLLGHLIAGTAESYACLPETIRMFPLPDELSRILQAMGFRSVRYRGMTNHIAVSHIGIKK